MVRGEEEAEREHKKPFCVFISRSQLFNGSISKRLLVNRTVGFAIRNEEKRPSCLSPLSDDPVIDVLGPRPRAMGYPGTVPGCRVGLLCRWFLLRTPVVTKTTSHSSNLSSVADTSHSD